MLLWLCLSDAKRHFQFDAIMCVPRVVYLTTSLFRIFFTKQNCHLLGTACTVHCRWCALIVFAMDIFDHQKEGCGSRVDDIAVSFSALFCDEVDMWSHVCMLHYVVYSRRLLCLVIQNRTSNFRRQCAFEHSIVEIQGVPREYVCDCDFLLCVIPLVKAVFLCKTTLPSRWRINPWLLALFWFFTR